MASSSSPLDKIAGKIALNKNRFSLNKMDTLEEMAKRKFNGACRNGETDIIDSMLDEGFNPNYYFHGGPLQIACTKTKPWGIDVVTKLITHGADVDAKDSGGSTALCSCLQQRPFQQHIAQLLLDCSKLGINRLDWRGRNYLFYANTLEACKLLIDNGIEVNNVDKSNQTALDYKSTLDCRIYDYLIFVGAKKASEL